MFHPILILVPFMLPTVPVTAGEPLYRAALETPAATRLIVKDMAWSCAGALCWAPRTAASPDINVCSALARKLGRVLEFQAGGRAFETAELEKCNMAAK